MVIGDPLGATTHSDLILRVSNNGTPYRIIHNSSILTAVGCCGLQLYNFGETVSIPFWTESWKPASFCAKINANLSRGLHTLCLLDIKVREQTVENLMKGNKIFEPPRYMSVNQAASQLLECATNSEEKQDFDGNSLCIGMARVGTTSQKIVTCTLEEMTGADLGEPPHSLVIVGKTHPLESEFIKLFMLENSTCESILNKRIAS